MFSTSDILLDAFCISSLLLQFYLFFCLIFYSVVFFALPPFLFNLIFFLLSFLLSSRPPPPSSSSRCFPFITFLIYAVFHLILILRVGVLRSPSASIIFLVLSLVSPSPSSSSYIIHTCISLYGPFHFLCLLPFFCCASLPPASSSYFSPSSSCSSSSWPCNVSTSYCASISHFFLLLAWCMRIIVRIALCFAPQSWLYSVGHLAEREGRGAVRTGVNSVGREGNNCVHHLLWLPVKSILITRGTRGWGKAVCVSLCFLLIVCWKVRRMKCRESLFALSLVIWSECND